MSNATSANVDAIKNALHGERRAITLADVATKTGLSLGNAKEGLTYLLAEFRGGLMATADGELLYSFPSGFTKPWERQEKWDLLVQKVGKSVLGAMKLVVRAWISIVMVAYVVIFALILIALTFSKSSEREERSSFSGGLMMHMLMRMVFDAIFWTFHPFSPFRIDYDRHGQRYEKRVQTPFYERVNRFFFGPEEKPFDISEAKRLTLQEIRAKKGRIGMLDVMRVTGLSKEEADPFLARLLLEYEGDVKVSLDGGIYYEFESMRRSALDERVLSPSPIWQKKEKLAPFTGNTAGSNLAIAALNGFNLLMSSVAISSGWTIEKFHYFITMAKNHVPPELLPPPPEGTPLVLGWIPFVFSITLFLIPALRAMGRSKKQKEIERKNGRRGLIRAILSTLGIKGVEEAALKKGWTEQASTSPSDREFAREIARLGGDAEIGEDGSVRYIFTSLEAEMKALEAARKRAPEREVHVGDVVFSSLK